MLVMLAFIVFGLISSVLSHEIGWAESLENDVFCVKWVVKKLNSRQPVWSVNCIYAEDKSWPHT